MLTGNSLLTSLAAALITLFSLISSAAPAAKSKPVKPQPGAAAPVVGTGTPTIPPTRWALVIGIGKYQDETIPAVPSAATGARAVREALVDPAGGGYAPENVLLMVDDANAEDLRPNRVNLLARFAGWTRRAAGSDTLLVYLAGHVVEEGGEAYLLPSDARSGAILADTAVSFRRIDQLLHHCPARTKVLFLDICHAAAGKDRRALLTAGLAAGLFPQEPERLTFASCRQGQQSYDWAEQGQSTFAYFLTDGMRGGADADHDGVISAAELAAFTTDRVRVWATERRLQQEPFLTGAGRAEAVVCGNPRKARTGSLRITSMPPGARVTIDGTDRGSTPLLVVNLPVGEHLVAAAHPAGSEQRQVVRVHPDAVTEVEAKLKIDSGWLSVTSEPPGALLFLDDNPRGRTGEVPVVLDHVAPGKHQLRLVRDGYVDYRGEVQVEQAKGPALSVALARIPTAGLADGSRAAEAGTGAIRVSSTPQGADVLLDGVWAGLAPAVLRNVPSGAHKITLSADGHKTYESLVLVKAGETRESSTKLSPIDVPPERVRIVDPPGPTIVVRGEPLDVEVDVHTRDFIGGASIWVPGVTGYHVAAKAASKGQWERFTLRYDTRRLNLGDYVLVADAYQLSGRPIRPEARLPIRVIDQAPLVLRQPVNGEVLQSGTVIVGEGDPAVKPTSVGVYLDNALFGQSDSPGFRIPWPTPGELPGEHTLQARLVDAGGRTYVTPPLKVGVPEHVRLLSPDPKRYVIVHPKQTDVPLRVAIDGDYDVESVQYFVDGQVIAGGGPPTYASSWDCRQAEDRYYEITAQATLANGGVLRSPAVRVWVFNYLVDTELTRILVRQLREREVAAGGDPGSPVGLGLLSAKQHMPKGGYEGPAPASPPADRQALHYRRGAMELKLAVTLLGNTGHMPSFSEARDLLQGIIREQGVESELARIAVAWLRENNLPAEGLGLPYTLDMRPIHHGRY